ncbi:hypothetical protein [Streptomyces sp. NPDC008137]|uniref:hypothetical protein n=1 Tax=Streptomyces sp. NPDC008137 TaxID=3364813 RepID=UPI0036E1FF06
MPKAFETAVNLRVEYDKKLRAGDETNSFLLDQVLPAVEAAERDGCNKEDIHDEADRRYGQWLIDGAGRKAR